MSNTDANNVGANNHSPKLPNHINNVGANNVRANNYSPLQFETRDGNAVNVEKIAELFPGVVVEGTVNFELLRSMLGDDVFGDEAYEFTWVGKRAAIAEAGRPIRKTLRPCVEESKNWDTTENLYIEGDNLDVLKLLQESYLGKVKMIYIDPPYNTGNDFIYRDDFAQSREEYEDDAGVYDEDGDRLFRNTETNGRFHSDWCSMIYPRLVLARNLLSKDGFIFISIGEEEIETLLKICDEVFGKHHRLGTFIWKRRQMVDSRSKRGVSEDHEYMLCYAKTNEQRIRGKETDMTKYSNPDKDPRGDWMSADMTGLATASQRPNLHYELTNPKTGILYSCPSTGWRYERKKMAELIENDEIIFPALPTGRPRRKKFSKDLQNEFAGLSTILDTVFNTQATRELKQLFDGKDYFDFPKPVDLIKLFVQQGVIKEGVILDFFSGSATTAHAVMQLNAEDGGKRKFIMVQLPEICAEGTEAAKAGYKTICEIGKERIRRAGEKIVDSGQWLVDRKENTNHYPLTTIHCPDTGFRVLKLDDTNMTDVYYAAGEYTQDMLPMMESNIKPDRTDMDLLYACLLDWGLPLSMPHTVEWLVDSDKWLEIMERLEKNGCKRLHRVDCLAKGDGISGRGVQNSEVSSERGVVCIVGSNSAGGSFNSIQHSRGTSAAIDEGVSKLSIDSARVESRIGNTASCVCKSGIFYKFGYYNSNAIIKGGGQDVTCSNENTSHCPLTTNHLYTVHTYNGGDLIACFEERISEKAIREIAARKPLRAVFRDSGFTSSPEKINVFEIFKLLAPNTTVKVI